MANNYFQFKQFTVYHDLCAMKVGTDGVLLGAWSDCEQAKNILDVGTGSGLIALMMSQRSQANIDAIDLDENAYKQASINMRSSIFSDRINVILSGIETFETETLYDLIVCNPPFFAQSLKSQDDGRNMARHNDTLPFELLIKKSASLLCRKGILSVIIPSDSFNEFDTLAGSLNFYLKRKRNVVPKPAGEAKRVLLEYTLLYSEYIQEEDLIIELDRHVYSPSYINLTKDFYLNMD